MESVINKSNKELLSEHVENIFKGYSEPGIHICDVATGGGKSYTIGKLTCEYYPDYFERIIILCVQNKLVDGMNREIDRFIASEASRIKPTDKLVIEKTIQRLSRKLWAMVVSKNFLLKCLSILVNRRRTIM